jgi:F-type H+-transporting ATPase subunit b
MNPQLAERRESKPVHARVGTAAPGCPAERTGAPDKPGVGLTGWRSSAAALRIGLLTLTFLALSGALTLCANAQEPSAAPSAQQQSAQSNKPAEPAHETIAGELVKETREAAGEDEEEHADLKHAKPVRWLARKIDWSVHGTHLLLSGINFAIIAVILIWAARKYLPGMFRNRTASIQQALQEARAASQDANRRLADIENRLRQLDVEIGRMQSSAESEAAAEEARVQKAAEDDVRKVVLAAEQEIAAAAKQARRELSNYTASLAISLASKQISVDSDTDQVLVRTFAAKLANNNNNKDGGKDGH